MLNTLIIGASLKEERYSNMAIRRLRASNFPVLAIGRTSGFVEDVEIKREPIIDVEVHTVSLYLNKIAQEIYYDYIINLKPKRIIFNPGTENPVLAKLCNEASIEVLHACTLVMLSTKNYH